MKKRESHVSGFLAVMFFLLSVVAVLLLATSVSMAQEPPRINRLADAPAVIASGPSTTEYAVVLEVFRVSYAPTGGDGSTATVIRLQTAEGQHMAYMGPTRFLENRSISFTPGESLIIQGVTAQMNGENWLLARVFSNNEAVIALRGGSGGLDEFVLARSWACGGDPICTR